MTNEHDVALISEKLADFMEEHAIENSMMLAAYAINFAFENANNSIEIQARIETLRDLLTSIERQIRS